MVQFAGFASHGYGFTVGYPKGVGCPIRTSEDHRALAPPLGFSQRATSFIASRYQGIHQMPFMCCARAQPRARRRSAAAADVRRQMSDGRRHRARPAGRRSAPPHPAAIFRSSRPRTAAQTAAPADARASARIPMLQVQPHPTSRMMAGRSPDLLHGHDSLHDFNRTDDGCQMTDVTRHPARSGPPPRHPRAAIRHSTRSDDPDARPQRLSCRRRRLMPTPAPSDICHLTSVIGIGGPGPI
jgi:hypothetical protein